MRITFLTRSDSSGGAARAVLRLHRSLLEHEVDSKMLVIQKQLDDPRIIAHQPEVKSLLQRYKKRLESRAFVPYRERIGFPKPVYTPDPVLINKINSMKPDVVHLHWLNTGVIRLEDLVKIRAPLVWTLHDNWVITGGCHYTRDCTAYLQKCGNCPNLNSNKEKDLSRSIFLRKQKVFNQLPNLKFIAPSRWLADLAKESALLKNHEVVCIPNTLDTSTFTPHDRARAREILNLPPDKKLIAFGAATFSNKIKGCDLLIDSLNHLKTQDTEIILFGAHKGELPTFPIPVHSMGYIGDDLTLRQLYSAADVMVVPSRQEVAAQTVTESLACGTPVVAFNTSGLPNLIDHQLNGYLAKPFEPTDLAHGIDSILNHPNPSALSQNARQKALSEFDSNLNAKKHIELYRKVIR